MQTQLSALYRYIVLCTVFLFLACDPDDGRETPRFEYDVAIKNDSNEAFTIYGYRTKDLSTGQTLEEPQLKHSLTLASGAFDEIQQVVLPAPIDLGEFIYPGFENNIDSVVVKFNNTNRGYYVKIVSEQVMTENWISNKSSILNLNIEDLEQVDNLFYYRISQEDAESAYEL